MKYAIIELMDKNPNKQGRTIVPMVRFILRCWSWYSLFFVAPIATYAILWAWVALNCYSLEFPEVFLHLLARIRFFQNRSLNLSNRSSQGGRFCVIHRDSFNSQVALWYYYFMFTSSEYPIEKLRRRFIGFLLGQDDLITAENNRRHESRGVVVREILDFGIPLYRKKHKLPAAYPSNGLEN